MSILLRGDLEYLCSVDLTGDEVLQTREAYTAPGLRCGCVEGSLFVGGTAFNVVVVLSC